MPRKPIDYKKSVIYTIKTGNGLYVGSTTDFRKRKWAHKSCIYDEKQNNYNLKLYQTIRANNFEWDMKPYKEYPCENNIQLIIEEERIKCELNADLNMNNCHGRNEEKVKEREKQYRNENKDKIKEYQKTYRDKNKANAKEYQKTYSDKNKEFKKERNKKYYEKNRDKFTKIIICECGCKIQQSLSNHKKTEKHKKLMEILNNNE